MPSKIKNQKSKIHEVPGFRTAALHCGLKTAPNHPPDLALLYAEGPATVAGVFTGTWSARRP